MPPESLPDRPLRIRRVLFGFVLLARENDHLGWFGATIFADLSINPERSDLTQGGGPAGRSPPGSFRGGPGGRTPPGGLEK